MCHCPQRNFFFLENAKTWVGRMTLNREKKGDGLNITEKKLIRRSTCGLKHKREVNNCVLNSFNIHVSSLQNSTKCIVKVSVRKHLLIRHERKMSKSSKISGGILFADILNIPSLCI